MKGDGRDGGPGGVIDKHDIRKWAKRESVIWGLN